LSLVEVIHVSLVRCSERAVGLRWDKCCRKRTALKRLRQVRHIQNNDLQSLLRQPNRHLLPKPTASAGNNDDLILPIPLRLRGSQLPIVQRPLIHQVADIPADTQTNEPFQRGDEGGVVVEGGETLEDGVAEDLGFADQEVEEGRGDERFKGDLLDEGVGEDDGGCEGHGEMSGRGTAMMARWCDAMMGCNMVIWVIGRARR
jgi:hypothetical protein